MHVLGIDETAANALLHVDEVEHDDTIDISPVLRFNTFVGVLWVVGGQLQIDSRCQCHLVVACASVALAVALVGFFPLIERLAVGSKACLSIFRCARAIEEHVAGQCAEEVYVVVYAEVVSVFFVFLSSFYAFVILDDRFFFVERNLSHTVDGVVGVVYNLRHAVLCSLHHHSATKHSTEVGTLYGVHDASCIARAYTVFHPVGRVGLAIGTQYVCAFKSHLQLIGSD